MIPAPVACRLSHHRSLVAVDFFQIIQVPAYERDSWSRFDDLGCSFIQQATAQKAFGVMTY
jgi:hypothetical protein